MRGWISWISVLMMACTGVSPGVVEVGAVNDSEFDFEELSFHNVDWGGLAAGEETDLFEVDQAYDYTYVRLLIDGKELVNQPIDYVGESPLPPGRYRYVISVEAPEDGMVVSLLELGTE